jgi:hypothetical protein
MSKLTDTQTLLLTTAAARENGSLLPLPEALGKVSTGLRRSIATLIANGLAAETEAADEAATWGKEDDRKVGLVITDAGRTAIGVPVPVMPAPAAPEARITKIALVTDLLQRADGATLAELVEATGWLPHTTRAALTGLRKKGHVIERSKRDDQTCYRIAAAQ